MSPAKFARLFAAVALVVATAGCPRSAKSTPHVRALDPPPASAKDESADGPVVPVVLPEVTASKDLALTEAHREAIEAHLTAVAAADGAPESTCSVLRTAGTLADILLVPLLVRRDALFFSARIDPFSDAVDALSDALPGVFLESS